MLLVTIENRVHLWVLNDVDVDIYTGIESIIVFGTVYVKTTLGKLVARFHFSRF